MDIDYHGGNYCSFLKESLKEGDVVIVTPAGNIPVCREDVAGLRMFGDDGIMIFIVDGGHMLIRIPQIIAITNGV